MTGDRPAQGAAGSPKEGDEGRALVRAVHPCGPLRHTRVVDLGWAWAGATCGQILGDFGAEVIKVESRKRLDPMRQGRPIIGTEPDPEQNPVCHNVNRNKFSFGVDLTSEGGADLVRELIRESDVLVENMTPGVMERFGLDWATLSVLNPALVMVSLPGVASDGPLSNVRSYGPVVTALSGLDALTGYEGESPIGFQHPIADPNVGLHAAVAVLAALRHRRRTGEGQYIQTSQVRSLLPVLSDALLEYSVTGRTPGPAGNRRRGFAPHGLYPALGDDRWVSIAVKTQTEWEGLCQALEGCGLADDPRFQDPAQRQENARALDEIVGSWTRTRAAADAARILQAHGVPAAPSLDTAERFQDAHLQERETIVSLEHPVLGTTFVFGSPWKSAQVDASVWKRVPLLGEDTDAVLREILHRSEFEIAALREAGVVE